MTPIDAALTVFALTLCALAIGLPVVAVARRFAKRPEEPGAR